MTKPHVTDLVVLTEDLPELDLHFGDVGLVRGVWPGPQATYEVEFRPEGSSKLHRAVVRENQIYLAPKSPFDPEPMTGRSWYF